MKAIEFVTILRGHTITIPDDFHEELKTFEERAVRVIISASESYSPEDNEYRNMVREHFFAGYDDIDSIYDKP